MISRQTALGLLCLSIALFVLLSTLFYPSTQTGQLTSPQISGLYYQTSSGYQGFTQTGHFNYQRGDTISFFWGNQDAHVTIGTASAQPYLNLANLVTSPQRNHNLLRALVALHQGPKNSPHIELDPAQLSTEQWQLSFGQANWSKPMRQLNNLPLPDIQQVSTTLYSQETARLDTIVFEPLNIQLRETFIKLTSELGEPCYYDLAKKHIDDYSGPLGRMTFKVTAEGIYSYPDIGDYFGSTDGQITNCELNPLGATSEPEFIPLDNFEGFQGVIACAQQGCRRNDLTGFSIDDYADGGNHKFRTVAISFDPETQIVVKKTRGLGPNEYIKYANKGEALSITYPVYQEKPIKFEGLWHETQYSSDGSSTARCLYIQSGRVYANEYAACSTNKSHYTTDVSRDYLDMWWLTQVTSSASIGQLNTPVKWVSNTGDTRYTSWEYSPAGADWQAGTLYRMQQPFDRSQNSATMTLKTVMEYTKISD